jgi:hypothetical protein
MNRKKTRNYVLTINWGELGLILSILAVITVGSVIVMVKNAPLTPGDMWSHYGSALGFSNGFPVYGGKLITYTGGYLFAIYLSILFSLSGIPPAIAEQGLYILSFMPFLAFYSAIKVWLNGGENQKLVSKAALFSTLLGFGGLYALYARFAFPAYSTVQILSTVNSKTYDIYMRVLYLPDVVAPLWIIGLPVFFVLLYFIKKEAPKLTKATLIPLIVLLGYLAHAPEIFLFVLIFFIFVLFLRRKNDEKIGPYITLGLGAVALLDYAAPGQVYVLSNLGTALSLTFVVSLILAASISVAEIVKDRYTLLFLTHLRDNLLEKLEKSWMYGRWVLIYIYVFFFVIWLAIVKDFNLWDWGGGYNYTPFFVLPVRLGAVGLLAVISIVLYFKRIVHNRAMLFFLLLIPTGFLLEQAANYFPIYSAYRFGTITFVGACVIAAYGITKIIDKVRKDTPKSIRRNAAVSIVLGFFIISGMLSTALFYVNASYYSIGNQVPQGELPALDYIRQNTPANASVLTFTQESVNYLEDFAGINAVQNAQRWSQLLLSTSNPDIITCVLSSSNIKYIYVAQRDVALLNSSELNSFVKYFPKVISNDDVTVYEVPPLTAPTLRSSFGVLYFSPSVQTLENTSWSDESFAAGWYPYRTYGNVKNWGSMVINDTMNIWVTSNQSGNIWASYTRSGLSLNTTTYPTLSFNYRVSNNLSWFTFQLWNSTNQVFFYVGHLSDADFTTESFALPANQTVTRIEIIVETVTDAPADTTASAFIDYIQFSAPTSTWTDETFLKGWGFYEQQGNISNWSASSNGSILRLSVTSNQSGDVWVSYSLLLAIETKNSVLSFRYKVDNDYTWFTIILQNASKRFFFYIGHLTNKTFTTLNYPLPEGQTITRVELIVETTNNAPSQTTASAQIESVGISQQPFSEKDVLPSLFVSLLHSNYTPLYVDNTLLANLGAYLKCYSCILLPSDPSVPVQGLLDWVSAGNTLIVFNTEGNGFFANLLGINGSSPVLSINNLSSGTVLYVNSLPTVAAGNGSDILQPEFLEKVSKLLGLNGSVSTISILPVYNSIYGSMEFTGDLKVDTDALMLQGALNLTSSSIPVNESTEIKVYGKIDLTIENATFFISPSESYMLIKPESYPIKGEVVVDNPENVSLISDTTTIYNSDVPFTFTFNATALSLYARLPSMTASGTATFDELDVESSLYVPLVGIVQQPAEIQGVIKFGTLYISNPITIFSMFQAEGKVLNLVATSLPTIPWAEVLSSSYNVAFNIIFLLGMTIYFVKKKRSQPLVKK